MKIRIILSILLATVWLGLSAQSPAAQVKEIQKNPAEYISAESTDPNEDAALSNAMRQIIDMSRNFVATNANNASISDEAISAAVEKIVIPRGEFKRVFVYVKRIDLLEKAGTAISSSETEGPTVIEPQESESQENKEDTILPVPEPTLPDQEAEVHSENSIANDNSLEDVPQDIVAEIEVSSNVPAATKELIELLQNSKSLKEASDVLRKYKDRRIVSDYGVARQTRNSAACYWVVEENGNISVLGPEIRGHRHNFRTGKADALYRYTKGLWFRKR